MPQSIAPQNLLKQVQEKRQYSMDFSNLMASDETISIIDSVTNEYRGGGIGNLVISGETISGQTVTMWISGGDRAHTYRIEVTIQTSGLQKLQGDGLLRISD